MCKFPARICMFLSLDLPNFVTKINNAIHRIFRMLDLEVKYVYRELAYFNFN